MNLELNVFIYNTIMTDRLVDGYNNHAPTGQETWFIDVSGMLRNPHDFIYKLDWFDYPI